jgi:hypothetical protein
MWTNWHWGVKVTIVALILGVVGITIYITVQLIRSEPLFVSRPDLSFEMVSNQSASRMIGGAADRTGLTITSLKYYFTSIRLVNKVILEGTGYSMDASNPHELGILQKSVPVDVYDNFALEEAQLDKTNYKELIGDGAFKPEMGTNPEGTIGDYNYVLINWMKPIKVTATAVDDTGSIYTKTVSEIQLDDPGNMFVAVTTDMTVSPAEEAIIMHNNGGSIFKLLQPLTIAKDSPPQKVTLVYDPYQNVRAGEGNGGTLVDDLGHYFTIPIMDMSAIVSPAKDKITCEQYRIVLTDWDLWLQLYFVEADDVLRAANISVIAAEETALPENAPMVSGIFFVSQGAQGYTFKMWDESSMVSNFAPSESGTCQVHTSITTTEATEAQFKLVNRFIIK